MATLRSTPTAPLWRATVWALIALTALSGCSKDGGQGDAGNVDDGAGDPAVDPEVLDGPPRCDPDVAELTALVLAEYPHDSTAFTQGLLFVEGTLYEGTGRYGRSQLREVTLETGAVVRQVELAAHFFGEGLAEADGQLVQLTWREETALVYDVASLEQTGTFSYTTEGWGLAFDGEHFVMSDGSASLYFVDPDTFERVAEVEVTDAGVPVLRLNELEVIDGAVWANVWMTDRIVIIDPSTGCVTGRVDLSELFSPSERPTDPNAVLNGIAWDARAERLVVTGKLWPRLFEIRLVPR